MNLCNKMIEPNEILQKMLIMLRAILGIYVALIIAKGIFWGITGKRMDLFTDVFCLSILIITNINLFYSCGMMLLFFIIIRLLTCFFSLGTFIQQVFLPNIVTFDSVQYGLLGITTFEFFFDVFAIIVIFPIYKEMKAHFIEQGAGVGGGQQAGAGGGSNYQQYRDQENQISHNQQPQNSSSNSGGFRAFQGRGVALGGS